MCGNSLGFFLTILLIGCCIAEQIELQEKLEDHVYINRELIEEGRTVVHHAFKRFMIILPAIFFKLGVAFTLLVLVTIGVVINGTIGFLLLVVGLSSVLARLQGGSLPRPQVVPVTYLAGHGLSHAHSHLDYALALKRSDTALTGSTEDSLAGFKFADQYYRPYTTAYSAYVPTN